MPWARANAPSIQGGLLKATLEEKGIAADVVYLNLDLVSRLAARGQRALEWVVQNDVIARQAFLGDWLFAQSAFGVVDDGAYLAEHPDLRALLARRDVSPEALVDLRSRFIPDVVAHWAREIDWTRYSLVGFTCTFEQTVAGIALARAIKKERQHPPVVFGGAAFDAPMGPELLRTVPWIDFIVVGEGEEALPHLVEAVTSGWKPKMPGILGRGCGTDAGGEAPRVFDLDSLPIPDYEDYFTAVQPLLDERTLERADISLPVETSRGCWWGQRRQCGFCGLNGARMSYRAKSASRAAAEILDLVDQYDIDRVDAVDNVLDHAGQEQLCSTLACAEVDLRLFYEIRAALTRRQIRRLRDAGIREVQPGVESLSSRVLAMMDKGTTLMTNVRLLKWAHYYGIQTHWHIILGLPGEQDDDCDDQARLIPSLVHLPPPSGCGDLWLERYSPYFQGHPGIRDVRPWPAYGHAYPVPGIDLARVAYFFDFTATPTASAAAHQRLRDAVSSWQDLWRNETPPVLTYEPIEGGVHVVDRRSPVTQEYDLLGLEAAVHDACAETYRRPASITRSVRRAGWSADAAGVNNALGQLRERQLVVIEEDWAMSLALPLRSADTGGHGSGAPPGAPRARDNELSTSMSGRR